MSIRFPMCGCSSNPDGYLRQVDCRRRPCSKVRRWRRKAIYTYGRIVRDGNWICAQRDRSLSTIHGSSGDNGLDRWSDLSRSATKPRIIIRMRDRKNDRTTSHTLATIKALDWKPSGRRVNAIASDCSREQRMQLPRASMKEYKRSMYPERRDIDGKSTVQVQSTWCTIGAHWVHAPTPSQRSRCRVFVRLMSVISVQSTGYAPGRDRVAAQAKRDGRAGPESPPLRFFRLWSVSPRSPDLSHSARK